MFYVRILKEKRVIADFEFSKPKPAIIFINKSLNSTQGIDDSAFGDPSIKHWSYSNDAGMRAVVERRRKRNQ